MRIALGMLVALVGCTSTGPHDVVKCSGGGGECERACTGGFPPPASNCAAEHDGHPFQCTPALKIDGTTGCCGAPAAAENSTLNLVFYECLPTG